MEEVKAAGFDQLVRELLDDESPLFFPPEETTETKISPTCDELATDQLISTSYSGPTIQDIENALSIPGQIDQSLQAAVSQARIAMLERGLSEMENNKYTLKLKCCGDGMVDDGYKWRKYGQKSIKNSPYPRSYYRCTNPRCSAKRQVERSREDKDTLVITYEGLHLHFAYPYFLPGQSHRINSSFKKPKRDISGAESKSPEAQEATEEAEESLAPASPAPLICTLEGPRPELGSQAMGPQGLLEDVVPFMIRNPPTNVASSYSSSSSSYRSPPPSPSSLSCSPNYPYSCFDIAINHW